MVSPSFRVWFAVMISVASVTRKVKSSEMRSRGSTLIASIAVHVEPESVGSNVAT